MSQPTPIASTVWRLADSSVLIGVKQTAEGPLPLVGEVEGAPVGVAYTDPEEIRAAAPEGYEVYRMAVPEFLAQLPASYGLVIDPDAPSPVYVPAAQRDFLFAAALPFPPGAYTRVLQGGAGPVAFLDALRRRMAAFAGARRVFCTRYQVADARAKLLVVYECETGTDGAVSEAAVAAAGDVRLAEPMRVTALADVPEEFRAGLLVEVVPCYVRPDLMDELGSPGGFGGWG